MSTEKAAPVLPEEDRNKLRIQIRCHAGYYAEYLYEDCLRQSEDSINVLPIAILDRIRALKPIQTYRELYENLFHSSSPNKFIKLLERYASQETKEKANQHDLFDFKQELLDELIKIARKNHSDTNNQPIELKENIAKERKKLNALLEQKEGYALFKKKIIQWLASYKCLSDINFQRELEKCSGQQIIAFVIKEYQRKHPEIKSNFNTYIGKEDANFCELVKQQYRKFKDTHIGSTLVVEGQNAKLSDVLACISAESISELRILLSGTLHLDCDLSLPGVNLCIRADTVNCYKKITINTSGRNATPIHKVKAKSGRERREEEGFSNIPNGDDGKDGHFGEAGESAGNIQILASEILNPKDLLISVRGGNGARGQDGGDGDIGRTGENGPDGELKDIRSKILARFQYDYALASSTNDSVTNKNLSQHYEVLPKKATSGSPGGNGGNAGLGGAGGFGGKVYITDHHVTYYDNRENQNDQTGSREIPCQLGSVDASSGEDGGNGEPGNGGIGGKDGQDGVDIGYSCYGYGLWKGGTKEGEELRGKLRVVYERDFIRKYPIIKVIRTKEECKHAKTYQNGSCGKKAEEVQEQRKQPVEKPSLDVLDLLTFNQSTENNLHESEINTLQQGIIRLEKELFDLEEKQEKSAVILNELEITAKEIKEERQSLTQQSNQEVSIQKSPDNNLIVSKDSRASHKGYSRTWSAPLTREKILPAPERKNITEQPPGLFNQLMGGFARIRKSVGFMSPKDEILSILEALNETVRQASTEPPSNEYEKLLQKLATIGPIDTIEGILADKRLEVVTNRCFEGKKLTMSHCQSIYLSCEQLIEKGVKDRSLLRVIQNNALFQFRNLLLSEYDSKRDPKIAKAISRTIIQVESLLNITDLTLLQKTKFVFYKHLWSYTQDHIFEERDIECLHDYFDKLISAFDIVEKLFDSLKGSHQPCTLETCYESLNACLSTLTNSEVKAFPDTFYIETVLKLEHRPERIEKRIFETIKCSIANDPEKLNEQIRLLNLITLEASDLDVLKTAIEERLDKTPPNSLEHSILLHSRSSINDYYSREYLNKLTEQIENVLGNHLSKSTLLYDNKEAVRERVFQLAIDIQVLLENENLEFSFTERVSYYIKIINAIESPNDDIISKIIKIHQAIASETSKISKECEFPKADHELDVAIINFNHDLSFELLLVFWSKLIALVDGPDAQIKDYHQFIIHALVRLNRYLATHTLKLDEIAALSDMINGFQKSAQDLGRSDQLMIERINKIHESLNRQFVAALDSRISEKQKNYELCQKAWLDRKNLFLQKCQLILSRSTHIGVEKTEIILAHIDNNLEKYGHSHYPKGEQIADDPRQRLLSELLEEHNKKQNTLITPAKLKDWEALICSSYNKNLSLDKLRPYLSSAKDHGNLDALLDLTLDTLKISPEKMDVILLGLLVDIFGKVMFPSCLQESIYKKLKNISEALDGIKTENPTSKSQLSLLKKNIDSIIQSIDAPQRDFSPNQQETDRICENTSRAKEQLIERLVAMQDSSLSLTQKDFFPTLKLGIQKIAETLVDDISLYESDNYLKKLDNEISLLILKSTFSDGIPSLDIYIDAFDEKCVSDTNSELYFGQLLVLYYHAVKNSDTKKLKLLFYRLTMLEEQLKEKNLSNQVRRSCNNIIIELAKYIILEFITARKSDQRFTFFKDEVVTSGTNALRFIADFTLQYSGSLDELGFLIEAADQISPESNDQIGELQVIEAALCAILQKLFIDSTSVSLAGTLVEKLLYSFEYLLNNVNSKEPDEFEYLSDKFSKILQITPLDFEALSHAFEMFMKLKNQNICVSVTTHIGEILLRKFYQLFDEEFCLSDIDKQMLQRILNSDIAYEHVDGLISIFYKFQKQPEQIGNCTLHEYFIRTSKSNSLSVLKNFNHLFSQEERDRFQNIIALNPEASESDDLQEKLLTTLPSDWESVLYEKSLQLSYKKLLKLFGVSLSHLIEQASSLLDEDATSQLRKLINDYDDHDFSQEEMNQLLSPVQKYLKENKDKENIKQYLDLKNSISAVVTFKKRFNSTKFFLKAAKDDTVWMRFIHLLLNKINTRNSESSIKDILPYINNIFLYVQHLDDITFVLHHLETVPFDEWLTYITREKLNENLMLFIRESDIESYRHKEIKNEFQKALEGKLSQNSDFLSILLEKISSESRLVNHKSRITPNELLSTLTELSKSNIELSNTILDQLSEKSLLFWKKYIREVEIRNALHAYGFESTHIDNCVLLLKSIENKGGASAMEQLLNCINSKRSSSDQDAIVCQLLRKINQTGQFLNETLLEQLKVSSFGEWGALIDLHRKNVIDTKKRTAKEITELMQTSEDNKSISHLLGSSDNQESNVLLKSIQEIHAARDHLVPLLEGWNESSRKKYSFLKKNIAQWEQQDIQVWSKYIRSNAINKDYIKNNRAAVLAILARSVELLYHYQPYDTQYAALLVYLDAKDNTKSRLGQIFTGQGKSLIIAMYAIMLALEGERIDIITSSSLLAERDALEAEKLFAYFNIKVSNNCDKDSQKDIKLRKERYEDNQVIYGDISSFQRDTLLTEFFQNDVLSKRTIGSVIVDEVDSMMLDKSENVLYLSHDIPELKYLHNLYVHIWSCVYAPDVLAENHDVAVAKISACIKNRIKDEIILLPDSLKIFADRRLDTWIKNALIARDISVNDPYILDKDDEGEKILLIDKDTGVEQSQAQWSEGLHQFLQLKHSQKLSIESLKAVFISNLTYFKRYGNKIYGLTGTIGANPERDLLAKTYGVDFFNLPLFKGRNYIQEDAIVVSNKITKLSEENAKPVKVTRKDNSAWHAAILNDVEEKFRAQRATLIICESIEEVKQLETYFKDEKYSKNIDKSRIKCYERSYCSFEIGQKNNPVQAGDVIIATNLAGRGTDLKLSEDLEKAGGLHVVLSYLPYNQRIEEQAFGRTARKDIRGTGRLIIRSEDSSLSIEQLKDQRNTNEEARLERIRIEDLQSIEVEEALFKEFTTFYQYFKRKMSKTEIAPGLLSSREFTAFYQSLKLKISETGAGLGLLSSAAHEKYVDIQLAALKDHWAFWLDKMSKQIKAVSVTGKDDLFSEFEKFKIEMEEYASENGVCKLARKPFELITLGLYFLENKFYKQATTAFERIIETDSEFSEIAHYYLAIAIAHLEKDNYTTRCKISNHLLEARKLIDHRMEELHNANSLLELIFSCNALNKNGKASSQHEKQVKNEHRILSAHQSAIDLLTGRTISAETFSDVYGVKGQTKQAEEIFNKLRNDEVLIDNSHLSENLMIRERKDGDALYLTDTNVCKLIGFPSEIEKIHLKMLIQCIKNHYNQGRHKSSFSIDSFKDIFVEKDKLIKDCKKANCFLEVQDAHIIIEAIDHTVEKLEWPDILKEKKDAILQVLINNEDKEFDKQLFFDFKLSDFEFEAIRLTLSDYLRTESIRQKIVLPNGTMLPPELKSYKSLLDALPKDIQDERIFIDLKHVKFVDDPLETSKKIWSYLVNKEVVFDPKVKFPQYKNDVEKNIEKRKDEIKEHLKNYAYPNFNSSLLVKNEKGTKSVHLNGEKLNLSDVPDHLKSGIIDLISKKAVKDASIDKRKVTKDDIANLIITKEQFIKLLMKKKCITRVIEKEKIISYFDYDLEELAFKDPILEQKKEEIISKLIIHEGKVYAPSLFDKLSLSKEQLSSLSKTIKPILKERPSEFELSLNFYDSNKLKLGSSLKPYQSLIEEMMNNGEIIHDSKIMNNTKTYSIKQEKIKLSDDIADQTEKIWGALIEENIISNSIIDLDSVTRGKPKFSTIAAEKIMDVLGNKKKDHYDQLLDSLYSVLLESVGGLRTISKLEVGTKELRLYFPQGEYPPEIDEYRKLMFNKVITVTEAVSRFSSGALAVAFIGVAQIAIGVALEVYTFGIGTAIAAILIAEGIGDIIYATQAGLSGTFSWRSYGIHKAVSLILSTLTVGLAAYLTPASGAVDVGARVAMGLFKNSCKRVAKESIKAVSAVAVNFALDHFLKTLPKEIMAQFRTSINKIMNKVFSATILPLKKSMKKVFHSMENTFEAKKFIKETFNRVLQSKDDDSLLSQIRYSIGSIFSTLPELIMDKFSGNLSQAAVNAISKVIKATTIITQDLYELKELGGFVKSQYEDITQQLRKGRKVSNPSNEINEEDSKFIDETIDEHSSKILEHIWDRITENMLMPHIMGEITKAFDKVCDKILQIQKNWKLQTSDSSDDNQLKDDLNSLSRVCEGSRQEAMQRSLQEQETDLLKLDALDALPSDVVSAQPRADHVIRNKEGMTVQQFQSTHSKEQYQFYYDDRGSVYVDEGRLNKRSTSFIPDSVLKMGNRLQDSRRVGQRMTMPINLSKHILSRKNLRLPKKRVTHFQDQGLSKKKENALFYTKLATTAMKLSGWGAVYYVKRKAMCRQREEVFKQIGYLKRSDVIQRKTHNAILEINAKKRELQIESIAYDVSIRKSDLLLNLHKIKHTLIKRLPEIIEDLAKDCEMTTYSVPLLSAGMTDEVENHDELFFKRALHTVEDFSELLSQHFQKRVPEEVSERLSLLKLQLKKIEQTSFNINKKLIKLNELMNLLKTGQIDKIRDESHLQFIYSTQLKKEIPMSRKETRSNFGNELALISPRSSQDFNLGLGLSPLKYGKKPDSAREGKRRGLNEQELALVGKKLDAEIGLRAGEMGADLIKEGVKAFAEGGAAVSKYLQSKEETKRVDIQARASDRKSLAELQAAKAGLKVEKERTIQKGRKAEASLAESNVNLFRIKASVWQIQLQEFKDAIAEIKLDINKLQQLEGKEQEVRKKEEKLKEFENKLEELQLRPPQESPSLVEPIKKEEPAAVTPAVTM